MVRVRTSTDITLSILDFLRTAQPQLDLKPGQVARDLLVDGVALQISQIYEELSRVQGAQSLLLSLGSELDAIASNYGASRRQGSTASGIAILTFNAIDADIPINKGSIITASNGASFTVNNSSTVSVTSINTYRATASKYQAALNFVGITDQYAVEVTVTATTTGLGGNISQYALNSTSIPGVSGVTNPTSFSGGSAAETDSAFKRRILGIFSGANTGTATGYTNTVMSDPDVVDAVLVGPGDTLMTRDGTIVYTAPDGTKTITSEGTGGKVDIYVYGFRLNQVIDTYIYLDKSNKNDPTSTSNDHVLGQISADENKTVPRKRIDDIANQQLPSQPVTNIISISGSSSGSNYVEKTTDSNGVVSGNYELVFDTGAYAGSPWGFDHLHWIDDRIRDYPEDITKGKFNSQDPLGFSDVTLIDAVTQSIQVTNENSKVNPTNRSSIQLSHYPVSSVTRVFNQTTGERYIVSDQNPNGGTQNTTGVITITGSTLPAVSDILQVDYTWIFNYDPNWDFDNRSTSDNIRSAVDSVDWGYSNNIHREEVVVQTVGTQQTLTVSHAVNSVVSVNTFVEEASLSVILVNGRLSVQVSQSVTNVISVLRSDNEELFNTSQDNGNFSGYTIYLPTDTVGKVGDVVTVRYNSVDQFTVNGVSGSFSNNIITISASSSVTAGTIVEVNYLANVTQLLPSTTLSALPVSRYQNYFKNSSGTFGIQPTTNIYSAPLTPSQAAAPPVVSNLRRAPTRLRLNISGTISPGVITVAGTSIQGIFSGVFTTTAAGLTHDLSALIRSALGLTSNQSIPSSVGVIRLISFESVNVTGGEVTAVNHSYDVFGYQILDNTFSKSESIINSSLTRTQIKLPNTTSNNDNLPTLGQYIRVTFYIGNTSTTENVSFSKSGSLYTQNIFAVVNSISISSGFTSSSSQSATLTVSPQNQPIQGTRYTASYDYLAPKPNERITISYNMNQVVTDNTFAIERTRPIGADVLVKAAIPIEVDISLAIVVNSSYQNSSAVVAQNVIDAVTQALNATKLGTTINQSNFINTAYQISGVDRVRITAFNKKDVIGQVLTLQAQENQYFTANNVTVTVESY